MAPPSEKKSGTKSVTQREDTPLPEEKVSPVDTAPPQGTLSPSTPASPAPQPTAFEDAETQEKEQKLLVDALRELERRERQLHEREEVLKQGQQRLRQDRAAFEEERRQHHQEHERRRRALEEEDELQKREKARRARSRSKGRRTTRLAADDSWRRDDDREKRKKQQQQGRQHHHEQEAHKDIHSRHTSWSSIPASSDDDDAAEEPPSTTTLTNNTTWTSSDLSASYARYTAAWAALPPHSPHVPYPSPNHTAAELHDTAHLPPGAATGDWSADDVVKHNATRFFLAAHGVPVAAARATGGGVAQTTTTTTTTKAALDGVVEEKREVAGRGEEELKGLVREVRKELRRWHEDGLKYRSGGGGRDQGKVNEELVRNETARAVFNAFTELRDGLLAEVRRRKEMEKVEAVVDGGGEGGVDWTMRSEAML